MSKCIIIPDVHLKPWMFDEAEKILDVIDYDFIVCLGDLVDDWNQEVNLNLYADTLDRCLDFAKYSERHADHGELFIRVATAVIDTIPNSE